MSLRPSSGEQRDCYALVNEDLLEYDGLGRMRAVCHLLGYRSDMGPLVRLVGNFDGGFGTFATGIIHLVPTAIAERLHRDDFRLIEWDPHERERRFTEVALTPVPARPITPCLLVSDGEDAQPLSRNTRVREAEGDSRHDRYSPSRDRERAGR